MSNYTIGRGELWFDRFLPGTKTRTGERYLGNTPEFNLTLEEEKLEHFSSDRGIREQDDAISMQVSRSGTLVTDDISSENLALFFFGETNVLSVSAATIDGEAIDGVTPGLTYQLGRTAQNPSGARELDIYAAAGGGDPAKNIIVTDDDSGSPTTYTEGTDYTIDMKMGRLHILTTGTITKGTNLRVDYKVKASTRTRIVSGGTAVEGALRYIAFNPKGEQVDLFFPYVQMSPNGDLALKGEEWLQVPFNVSILKLDASTEAIYGDLRAVVVE